MQQIQTQSTISVQTWFNQWLALEQVSLTPEFHHRLASLLHRFERSLPPQTLLADVTSGDIVAFRQQLLAQRARPSTVNLYIHSSLKRAFQAAVLHGHVQRNPVLLIRKVRQGFAQPKATFTQEQIDSLLQSVAEGDDWHGLILAGYYTGQRLGDLARLRWNQIDGSVLTVVQQKTGRLVRIPIHPILKQWFNQVAPRATFVFPTLHDKRTGGKMGLSTTFLRLLEHAGIVNAQSPGRRNLSSLTFHSLRHTFNSNLANVGVPQEIRQLFTGHLSREVNDRYTHLSMETLIRAIEQLTPINCSPAQK